MIILVLLNNIAVYILFLKHIHNSLIVVKVDVSNKISDSSST